MNKKSAWLLISAADVVFLHCAASANDTTTYTYDALGRLIRASTVGGPNNGVDVATRYDPSGNRASYTVAGASSQPSFAISDVSVTEGGSLTFTVTKSGTATGSLSVSYASANGTATAPSDYTTSSGTLTFAQAETTKNFTVATTNDTAIESSETVLVNLSGATGGAIITVAQGTGTILDNDTPSAPSFSINDVSVTEGGTLSFTVTKTGAAIGSFSVNYATANGTATTPSDYTAASGTLTFAQADITRTISVATINDTATESTKTLFVNLSGATGGSTITDSQGSGSILDNDAGNQPPVAVNDTGSMTWCAGSSFNVLANDSDPDGNLPLALVSVSGGGTRGTPSIVNDQVSFEPSGITGTASVSYTIRDSLNATASATLTITIANGSCGPPQAPAPAPQSSDGEGGS